MSPKEEGPAAPESLREEHIIPTCRLCGRSRFDRESVLRAQLEYAAVRLDDMRRRAEAADAERDVALDTLAALQRVRP